MTLESLITTIASTLILPRLVLWCIYVVVMSFKRVRDRRRLRLHEKIVAYPITVIGFLVDVYTNLIPATILLLDPPRIHKDEWTITDRFQRYLDGPDGRRKTFAQWWKPKVNAHDIGHLE